MQFLQDPHPLWASPATLSPTLKSVTPFPNSATSPAHSWPITKGNLGGHPLDECVPFTISGSVPQMAIAFILHKTSPGSGSGTGNSRISKVLKAVSMQAFIVFGIIFPDSLPGQKNHRVRIDP